MSHLLNGASSGVAASGTAPAVYLPLDMRQTETEFVLEASIPGLSSAEIEVVSEQGILTIRGERELEVQPEGRYLRRERRRLSIFRHISLPLEVRESDVTARFANGVLSVRVLRVEASVPNRIKIEVGSDAPTLESASAQPVAAAVATTTSSS